MDPIILLTLAGLAGLIILNPRAFQAVISTVQGIMSRAFAVASK